MSNEIIKNMPFDEYLSLKRLSASGIKKLLVSSQDFWTSSWMNPNKREYKSDAFNLGTAYHTRILEGESVFNYRYAMIEKVDGRTKEGKAYKKSWALEHPNANPIDEETYADINNAMACNLEQFQGGDSEVTILWNDSETNTPMKARIDYLKAGNIYDLKTFSNDNADINQLIVRNITDYKYHVQAAVYCEALPEHDFTFVFQQTGQVNNCLVKHLPSNLMITESGRQLMRKGINKFAEKYLEFGDKPWYDPIFIEEFTDEQFPIWAL